MAPRLGAQTVAEAAGDAVTRWSGGGDGTAQRRLGRQAERARSRRTACGSVTAPRIRRAPPQCGQTRSRSRTPGAAAWPTRAGPAPVAVPVAVPVPALRHPRPPPARSPRHLTGTGDWPRTVETTTPLSPVPGAARLTYSGGGSDGTRPLYPGVPRRASRIADRRVGSASRVRRRAASGAERAPSPTRAARPPVGCSTEPGSANHVDVDLPLCAPRELDRQLSLVHLHDSL